MNQTTFDMGFELVMGPGQKFLFLGLGRVSDLWFGFEKFPLKIPNFSIFALWVKKISSDRFKKYLGQSRASLLFTTGQKYALVWTELLIAIQSFHLLFSKHNAFVRST